MPVPEEPRIQPPIDGGDRLPDGAAGDRPVGEPATVPDAVDGSAAEQPAPVPDDPSQPPTEAWLLAHSVPGRVRRAPRLGTFVVAGLLAGLVVGTTISLLAVPGSGLAPTQGGGVLPLLGGYTGVTLLTSLGIGALGALLGAAVGLWADRRSRR